MRIGILLLALAATLTAAACSSGSEEPPPTATPPIITLDIEDIPDATTTWNQPTAVVVSEDSIWVLDGGRDRILRLAPTGELLDTLCERDECQLALKSPLGMDLYGDRLYVANSGANSVVVLTLDGKIDQTIELPDGMGGPTTPGDIVISAGGDVYVSDVNNNRILHLNASGGVLGSIETTDPDDPRYRLLQPLGLALDAGGDLYVADAADGRVKRYSPEGRFLEEYLMLTNPAFSTPQDVAVGRDGTVYFSDGKRAIVQVFSPGGKYLGIVGLVDATRIDSTIALSNPYGLFIKDDRLYVTDLDGALFAFHIDPQYWVEEAAQMYSSQ